MKKILAAAWVIATLVLSILALSGVLAVFGGLDGFWNQPFSDLKSVFNGFLDRLARPLDNWTNTAFGWVMPFWVLNLLAFYVLTATAVFAVYYLAGSKAERPGLGTRLRTSLFWVLALPVAGVSKLVGKSKRGKTWKYGRVLAGYALALVLGYAGARVANTQMADPAAPSLAEATSYDFETRKQCAVLKNRYDRSSGFMQRNFDAAVANADWQRAERTAERMLQLAHCLETDLHLVDVTRVNFNIADEYYNTEQWGPAREHYAAGIKSYNALKKHLTIEDFDAPDAEDLQRQADLDLSVLFNIENIFENRLRRLTALRHQLAAPIDQKLDVSAVHIERDELADLRGRYWTDVIEFYDVPDADDLPRPMFDWLSGEAPVVIDELVEDIIQAGANENDPDKLEEGARALDLLLDEMSEYAWLKEARQPRYEYSVVRPAYIRDKWLDIEDKINRIYDEKYARNDFSFADFQYVIAHRVLQEIYLSGFDTGSYLDPDAPVSEPTETEQRQSGQNALQVAARMIDVVEKLPFDRPEKLLGLEETYGFFQSTHNADRISYLSDPYIVFYELSERLGIEEQAGFMFRNGAAYNVKHQVRNFQNDIKYDPDDTYHAYYRGLFVTGFLGAELGVGREEILARINGPDVPDPENVRGKWSEYIAQICTELAEMGMIFDDVRCEILVDDILKEGVSTKELEIIRVDAPAMRAVTLDKFVTIDLMFGTTRKMNPDSKSKEKVFTRKDDPYGNGWRGSVTLRADAEKLGPPMLADAFAEDDTRAQLFEFVSKPDIYGFDREAHEKFKRILKERLMEHAGEHDVLIFVHGVGNTFASASKRTAQLTYDLSFPGQAMFYTWPTENNFLGYFKDIDVTDAAISDYANFVEDAADTARAACAELSTCAEAKVHLIAHSHGSRVTVDGLGQLIDRRRAQGKPVLNLGQVIFAAPDEDGKKLRKFVRDELARTSDRVTIYANKSDGALWLSSVLRLFKWRGGLGKSEPGCSADLIDASDAVPFAAHTYFAKQSEVIADIRSLIWHQNLQPSQRCFLEQKDSKSGTPWKLSNDRCDITGYDIASQIAIQQKRNFGETIDIALADFPATYMEIAEEAGKETFVLPEPVGNSSGVQIFDASTIRVELEQSSGNDAVLTAMPLTDHARYKEALAAFETISNSNTAAPRPPCAP